MIVKPAVYCPLFHETDKLLNQTDNKERRFKYDL